MKSHLSPCQGALELCPACTTIHSIPQSFPGTECRKAERRVSLSHLLFLPILAWAVC